MSLTEEEKKQIKQLRKMLFKYTELITLRENMIKDEKRTNENTDAASEENRTRKIVL